MAKEIDKIIKSPTPPKDTNVLWDNGENLKIYRNGKWENANNAETNNLSIDPVILKYMCEPYVISTYEGSGKLPDDLYQIITDKENPSGPLKPIVLNTIVLDNYRIMENVERGISVSYMDVNLSVHINDDGSWVSI